MAGTVPQDFVVFVAAYGDRVTRACAEIAGTEELARAMQADLLATVAARWQRWPAGSRFDLALVRLAQLVRREGHGHPQAARAALDLTAVVGLKLPGTAADPDGERESFGMESAVEGRQPSGPHLGRRSGQDIGARSAQEIWARGHRVRRQRWLAVTVVVVLVAAGVAFSAREGNGPNPDPGPTVIPELVSVLRPFDVLPSTDPVLGPSPLLQYLSLEPSTVDNLAPLRSGALARARIVAAGDRTLDAASGPTAVGRLVIVGDPSTPNPGGDSLVLRFQDPQLAGAQLLSTSLSPDGTRVALARDGDAVVLDVRTGTLQDFPLQAQQSDPPVLTWLDTITVAAPGSQGSSTVDVTTGHVDKSEVAAADRVTVRGDPLAPILQLKSTGVGGPSTGDATRSMLLTGPLQGETVVGPPWLAAWRGPGWASTQLVMRACEPATLRLPTSVGVARSAVAALDRNGRYIRTLTSVDADMDLLGMLGVGQSLVAVHRDGRTLLLAWAPREDTLRMVMEVNGEATISLPDLIPPA